jgi:O-acetylhomoserine/O-acetylserine sulfhydrylase-like pyridoxal-dependent enzyme
VNIVPLAAHAGKAVDPATRAPSTDLLTRLPQERTGFSALDQDAGNIHVPSGDPTVRCLKEKLAALEGAQQARFIALMGRGIFRLDAGLEHPADICADLARCL